MSRPSSLYVSTATTRARIRRRKYYPLARVSSFFHFIHVLRTNRISRNTGFCFVEQRMQQRIFSYALRYDCATLTTTSCFDFFLFLFFFSNLGLSWIRMEGWSRIFPVYISISMFFYFLISIFPFSFSLSLSLSYSFFYLRLLFVCGNANACVLFLLRSGLLRLRDRSKISNDLKAEFLICVGCSSLAYLHQS